jgi:hypothetical protein
MVLREYADFCIHPPMVFAAGIALAGFAFYLRSMR